MNEVKRKPRVLVAMSGGVDSSVAAALLVEQGYDVIGMTMQVWDYSSCDIEEGNGTCCSSIDVDDARAVCDKLDIPFYVANCEEKFNEFVIQPFIDSYLDGKTPSPCVNCNTFLKFDHLLRKMEELGCDYLATGHYAKIEKQENGSLAIVTSEDGWKDQTYFLFTIPPEILNRLLFPIGDIEKSRVREIAEEQDLINAQKRDSTGICFVGKKGYSNFIEEQVDRSRLVPGEIKHYPSGKIMGRHNGIHAFTRGQRRGLGMDHHETLFVLKVDPEENTVWVGAEEHLFQKTLFVDKVNWLSDVDDGENLRVKIRFHHAGASAKVEKSEDGVNIIFDEPQRAITAGQAAVFYKENCLVGGGWIV